MIVGIAGRKRSGKDTLGQALVKEGFTRVGFADALKDLVAEILNLHPPEGPGHRFSDEQWADLKELSVAYLVGAGGMHEHTGRTILQRVGLAVRKVLGADTWVNVALEKCGGGPCGHCGEELHEHGKAEGSDPFYCPYPLSRGVSPSQSYKPSHDYVITDVRFGNEFRAIKKAGGYVIRVNRWDSMETLHDFQGIGHTADLSCQWKHPTLEIHCGLPPGFHPTSWSEDRHESENGLPDAPNNAYRYDAAFTGSMESNTAMALQRVKEWRRG